MRDTSLLAPAFALAGWTGCILLLMAYRRLSSGLSPKEFVLGESTRVGESVRLANRNYMNLLELPLLFYVVCLAAAGLPSTPTVAVGLAWVYVGLRMLHSVVHVTYNRVWHRFLAFALSNAVLVALWIVVGIAVFAVPRPA